MQASPTGWETPATGSSMGYRTRRPAPPAGAGWLGRPWPKPSWQMLQALLAVSALVGLLAAFQHVVASGVSQAQARHQADRSHVDGIWRCGALASQAQRAECRQQLDTDRGTLTASR